MVNGSLPEGWRWITISEIAESINPGFPSGQHNQESIGVPHLRPMNVSRNGEIDLSLVKYVEVSNYSTLIKGDILFNNTNSPELVGKTAYISKDTNWAFSNHMTRIRLRKDVAYPAWVATALHYLFLDGFFKINCRHHVNQASIGSGFLGEKVSIPLPPLPEQERIVAKIEELFTQLDAGVVALKRVKVALKRYKASILKAACGGRLVPQDPGDEPAEELLRRLGKEPLEGEGLQELPEGWRWTKVGDIVDHRLGKMLDKEKNKGELRPYIRNINVRWFKFDLSDIQYMRVMDNELENISIQKGDLVICEGGEPGRAAVWDKDEPMIIQKALHRVRPIEGVSPIYLTFCLSADANTGRLEKYFTGSTIKHFTGESLHSYSIPLPPLVEQHRIVDEVERRLSVMQEIEATVEIALARAGRLRQAILKRAFEGKLVEQNPEDEPVEKLSVQKRESIPARLQKYTQGKLR